MSQELSRALRRMEQSFEAYKQEFARDGQVTQAEAVLLRSVYGKLAALRVEVAEYERRRGAAPTGRRASRAR